MNGKYFCYCIQRFPLYPSVDICWLVYWTGRLAKKFQILYTSTYAMIYLSSYCIKGSFIETGKEWSDTTTLNFEFKWGWNCGTLNNFWKYNEKPLLFRMKELLMAISGEEMVYMPYI